MWFHGKCCFNKLMFLRKKNIIKKAQHKGIKLIYNKYVNILLKDREMLNVMRISKK